MGAPLTYMGSTQAVVYKKITTITNDEYDVKPFDNTGKVIPEQYIDVDMSVADLTLNIPDLAIFNGVYGTKIYLTVVNGDIARTLSFVLPNGQQFGSSGGTVSGPGFTGLNFFIEPISATEWSFNITT